jgi:hypothetical protein
MYISSGSCDVKSFDAVVIRVRLLIGLIECRSNCRNADLYRTDPDSTRVRDLVGNHYQMIDIALDGNHFPAVSFYVRKDVNRKHMVQKAS